MSQETTTEVTGNENEGFVDASDTDLISSQGINAPTDAELRGETTSETETSEETETSNEETTEEETTEESKSKEETDSKDKTKSTEEETANSEPVKDKSEHPKGYVPLAAIHEARGEIRYLKEQLNSLQEQVSTKGKPVEETEELDDFEELSDEAFEDLAEDNPAQAAIYLRKLNAHEASKRQKLDNARKEAEFAEKYEEIIESSVAEIEKVVPGIYDEDSEVQKELMEFAESFGFTEDMYYLTNPATKIILPGESEPLLLGDQSASILQMLVNAKEKVKAPDTSELETKLREEITAELMKKFKTSDSDTYRGLNQVSKSDSEIPTTSFEGKVLTTAQLEKLTPAEYEAYLSGQ